MKLSRILVAELVTHQFCVMGKAAVAGDESFLPLPHPL